MGTGGQILAGWCTSQGDGGSNLPGREDEMLWAISVVLIVFWMLGLVTGYETDLFIHGLYAIAVVLLLISINREVSIYRGLKRMVRRRNYRRATSGPIGV